jgi:hypothetical protein
LLLGNARGHWEGNTLVVETTNQDGKVWLDSVGNFYSDAARVVERFRLVDANTIDYEATIEDPKVYTRSWTIAFPLSRARAGGGGGANPTNDPYANEMWEHACHEGISVGHTRKHLLDDLGFKVFTGVVPPN